MFNIPREKRLCLFCHETPGFLFHILFLCPAHFDIRNHYLDSWIPSDLIPSDIILSKFMSDVCDSLTAAVAGYLSEILKVTLLEFK